MAARLSQLGFVCQETTPSTHQEGNPYQHNLPPSHCLGPAQTQRPGWFVPWQEAGKEVSEDAPVSRTPLEPPPCITAAPGSAAPPGLGTLQRRRKGPAHPRGQGALSPKPKPIPAQHEEPCEYCTCPSSTGQPSTTRPCTPKWEQSRGLMQQRRPE